MTVAFQAHAHLIADHVAFVMAAFLPRSRADHAGEHDSGAGPAGGTGATEGIRPYGRTPKLAPHIWLSKTVPLEYLDSVQVVSCGRGLSVGYAPLPG